MTTPQEKKRRSYAKDRRSAYGENAKASRKAIPKRKAQGIRARRHAEDVQLAQALKAHDVAELDAIDNLVRATPPREWRKVPDRPLGEVVVRKLAQRSRRVGVRARRERFRKGG